MTLTLWSRYTKLRVLPSTIFLCFGTERSAVFSVKRFHAQYSCRITHIPATMWQWRQINLWIKNQHCFHCVWWKHAERFVLLRNSYIQDAKALIYRFIFNIYFHLVSRTVSQIQSDKCNAKCLFRCWACWITWLHGPQTLGRVGAVCQWGRMKAWFEGWGWTVRVRRQRAQHLVQWSV